MARADVKRAQLEHTIEAAEKAILTAQQAERLVQQASTSADPKEVAHAERNLEQARHVVQTAIEHVKGGTDEHREQQVVQVADQLQAALTDLDAAQGVISTPKQIR